jgi:hypothetical protein
MTITLAGNGPEPMLLHRPATSGSSTWVVMVHALGENRTGNNYWLARAALALVEAGHTAVRFDLSGYGESLGDKDLTVWSQQIDTAVRVAAESGATDIYVTARGLHCALLDRVGSQARRVALFPPDVTALGWWSRRRGTLDPEAHIDAAADMDSGERSFWTACGAEANLVGGLEVPLSVMDGLIAGMAGDPRWDLVIAEAGGDRQPRTGQLACGRDPLTRLESDRAGLEHLLIRWLRGSPGRRGATP